MSRLILPRFNRRAVLQTVMVGGLAACVTTKAGKAGDGASGPPIVETSAGKVWGVVDHGVHAFKGIPYGAPTGGKARFLPPKAVAPWAGIKETVAYGHPSPQGRPSNLPAPPPPAPGAPRSLISMAQTETASEDCLALNLWTPAIDARKRPVMFWIHGGGFSTGSGASPWYDGVNLAAKQDVVVVTINHRLNVFGYLYLGDEGEYADSANAGMLDIVLALKWVKANIDNFGGDPSRVMIFGESGGGRKTSSMMGLTPAQGLFQRCVAESGCQLRLESKAVAMERTEKLLKGLGLAKGDYAGLQSASVDALLAAGAAAQVGTGQFRPVAGTPSAPAHPFDPAAPVMSANVPMIVGSNRTEASVFLGTDPKVIQLDEAGLQGRVQALTPPGEGPGVIAMYRRLCPQSGNSEILYMATTDRGYFLDTTILAGRKADQGRAPVWSYSFYRHTPVEGGRYFTPHASVIPFVFDNLAKATAIGGEPTPAAQKLADEMSAAWANFARLGDPNRAGVTPWPKYNSATCPTMIWDEPSRVENDPRGVQRKKMLSFGSQQYDEREPGPT